MKEPIWLTKARSYLGEREIPGPRHNGMILRMWRLIRAPFTDDETPWCAGFVGGVLEECGIRSSRSAAARSYVKWGVKLPRAVVGAIAVLERGPGFGHVFFVTGVAKDGRLIGIGGNQRDAVTEAAFDAGRVLSLRWPDGVDLPDNKARLPLMAWGGASSSREA